jgi:hypothetical protein
MRHAKRQIDPMQSIKTFSIVHLTVLMAVDQWVVRKSQRSRSRPAHHASPRAPSPLASRSATHQGRFPDQNVRSLVAARATVGVLVTTFAQRRSLERRRTAAHARAPHIGCECESLGVFPARAGPAGSGHQRPEQKFEVSAGHFHPLWYPQARGNTRPFKSKCGCGMSTAVARTVI